MMAAYQPQPGMHPGMAPHAHPAMTPGQPMNPAQMQQMGHPGAVTPGPHVTQGGAMMAMQPGVGPTGMNGQHPGGQMGGMPAQMGAQSMAGGMPNAHALSHLTPQAMQQQQMMQQHIQANPQLAMQQQAMMQRRMAAMQNGGMAPGMQQSAMQNMTPQALAQLQQNSQAMGHPQGVQLPQHLVQQQMQLRMQQQQQAAQNQQMQHQIAMQQANSQQSNQSAQAAAQQNAQGGQQQHPAQPMRPQSRMAGPNEQSQGGPPPSSQPNAQQGQTQQAPQQAAQQQAQQAQQGQSNQQPAQAQNPGQAGQQPQQMNNQQLQAMQRQRQMAIQQQNAMQAARMQQAQHVQQVQQQQSGAGTFILKAILFSHQLSAFDSQSGQDIMQWHAFADRHFAPDGRFIHSFLLGPDSTRKYEVPRATIPRYFQMYFDSHASSIQLHLEHIREAPMQPGRHQVSFSNATFTISYPNGARLEMHGSVKMLFAPGSDLIELMELHTASSEEHISRSEIERILSNWSPTMANKASPKATKKNLPKGQQKMQSQLEGLTIDHFPRTPMSGMGTADRVQAFLELSEPMSLMVDLIAFAQEKKMRPEQALDALVIEYESGAQQNAQGTPQINLPPNGVPAGNRTPSMGNMQMPNAQGQFSSPSVSNLNLPMQNGMPGMNGSPHISNTSGLAPNMNMPNSHTPSPHQSNMAAPPMVPQHSQQGTNSSAASANTSPNVNNKRRRSTVKLEGDDAGGDGSQGGSRVKPSPRMPKKSKPGGA